MGIAWRCIGGSYWGRATRSLSITYFTLSLLHYITSLNLSRAPRTHFLAISSGSFPRTHTHIHMCSCRGRTLSSGPTLYILRLPQVHHPFLPHLLVSSARKLSAFQQRNRKRRLCHFLLGCALALKVRQASCQQRSIPSHSSPSHHFPPNRSPKNQSPANKIIMSERKKLNYMIKIRHANDINLEVEFVKINKQKTKPITMANNCKLIVFNHCEK